MDIEWDILSLTWSNSRCGLAGIAKRLDIFFMSDSLCDLLGKYRSWNLSTGSSDHKAIILQLDFDRGKFHYPFKFNPTWLLEDDFNALVSDQWEILSQEVPNHFSSLQALIYKLNKPMSFGIRLGKGD